ncbi:DUF2752 domain-containing protein [Longimycelium tulufanense]|uniref:DUF2752 domain-containing protein n=1 Tax=Longimycelium tulufanense TaxID=907463 RepID=UPI001E5802BD|nr:DUF2752 domain-containing protein [Longimycelium tulufanense]
MTRAAALGGRSLPVSAVLLPGTGVAGSLLATGVVSVPCWFREATGLLCPFCGGSRVLGALLHGDLAEAWRLNAVGLVVVLPVLLAVLVAGVRRDLGRGRRVWPAGRRGRAAGVGLGMLLLAWGVLRNLPL